MYQTLGFMGIKKSLKKEDIKMDDQKEIKILKYFDDGLQNKNKKVWDYKGTTSSLRRVPLDEFP